MFYSTPLSGRDERMAYGKSPMVYNAKGERCPRLCDIFRRLYPVAYANVVYDGRREQVHYYGKVYIIRRF